MSRKIIKVTADREVTVHDFPEGTIGQQRQKLCELIGNGCTTIEHVKPRRLYTYLGHTNKVEAKNSKCVGMLCDEEFLLKGGQVNAIASYLYETDKHGAPILGNVLFVGEVYEGDGISFAGIEQETFEKLHGQLKDLVKFMDAAKRRTE